MVLYRTGLRLAEVCHLACFATAISRFNQFTLESGR